MQILSKMLILFETVGNNQSRLPSSTPCGKNVTTTGSARASEPSSWNRGELGLQHARSACLPFPPQSVRITPVLMRDGGGQSYREGMEVELLQDVADQIRLFSLLVCPVKGVLCKIHRQCWDVNDLAFRGNG